MPAFCMRFNIAVPPRIAFSLTVISSGVGSSLGCVGGLRCICGEALCSCFGHWAVTLSGLWISEYNRYCRRVIVLIQRGHRVLVALPTQLEVNIYEV